MEKSANHIVRLNTNENFYKCSSVVFDAIQKNLPLIYQYPPFPTRLEAKLAEKFNVPITNIVAGAGSVRLIDGIIQSCVEPDEEIILFERSFIAYEQIAAAHRRKYIFAAQKNFCCDLENVLPLINEKTKVIFIANPNNPTGTFISHDQLEEFLQKIPQSIFVVLDEAYCDYVTEISFPDSLALQKKYSNLIILRSFSKIYGLAGLRIGYGIMDAKIAALLKNNRIPYYLNSLSEDAALVALDDEKFLAFCKQKNTVEREYLFNRLSKAGFNTIPSQGNFIFVFFETDDLKESYLKKLLEAGLLVFNLANFGQDRSLRIGIGDRDVSDRICSAFGIS